MVAVLSLSISACNPRPSLGGLETKVHRTSLATFIGWWEGEQARANRTSVATIRRWWRSDPGRLDANAARRATWDLSTDFCSHSPDTGPSFDFRAACVRHDFAWRNLRRIDAMAGGGVNTQARRRRATNQFGADMHALCAQRNGLARAACDVVATTYHRVVLAVS